VRIGHGGAGYDTAVSTVDPPASGRELAPLPIRAHPLVLGVVLFLASELMFFAALFATYYDLRVSAKVWPSPGVDLNQLEGGIGTLLLFLSSLFTLFASRAAQRSHTTPARRWLVTAAVAAACFIALSLHGYANNRFGIATSAYGSIYYTLTGFHLLHVTVGIALLLAMTLGIRSPALRANERAGFEAMSYYWHFVFIVWLGIYPTVYWVK
jgi:cytochrome c oxidase subunit III